MRVFSEACSLDLRSNRASGVAPVDIGAPRLYLHASPRGPRPHRERLPGGGIGRRAGFRYQWPQGRGSSSLLLGTIAVLPSPARLRARSSLLLKRIHLHHGDLPEGLDLGPVVAVDSETMGLNPWR